jgi:hypothetical protein
MTDTQIEADLSRRSLVKTAAAVAAVGGTLALAGPAATAEAAGKTAANGEEQLPASRVPDDHRGEAGDGVLVRVLDVRTGTLEVYTAGGRHHTITDRALAAQLARLGR